jgi:glyoxylase-like metal-dependent hydrolase (beta-lactamase superfamily II)
MARKSYITSMPDKTGAFLLASKIIARHNGNIVRVSYNKAVDLHTLFIDVEASDRDLGAIADELESIGYLNNKISETRVIVVEIKIPDEPGAVLPILKILDRYDVNISYMNSNSNDTRFQNFKMGLLIENPRIIKMLLDDISELYQIDIADYDDSEKTLDNTIFYIRLANEMQKLMDLDTDKTMEFIAESNRILQTLEEIGENPHKVFEYIRRFAYFISRHRGEHYRAETAKYIINDTVTLYAIHPPCGSNTYVLDSQEELLLIDTGYAVYADELMSALDNLCPGWKSRCRRVLITHADVDHCGLLSKLENVRICLNRKSADSLERQISGKPDFRENSELNLGYSKLSRIISGYAPPDATRFELFDKDTPQEHDTLLHIGRFSFSGVDFEVFEGSGGHLDGEMVFACREYGILFTGDNLVNISGFSEEMSEFNSLAPYLMRSVNIDSQKATDVRKQINELIEAIQKGLQKPVMVCGGHGPVFSR